ncbi:MAG: hypothetical protein JRN18_00155 [Nitrososphaerota archaeon]|jgi:hypothetical protein|nr:hypothetical protein [Nitrososphaerota archaeon]MDG6916446.1 hypothetical protein [Nitrososphaerota archaeon]MDG6918839.1 hypothetical protein [Nitrososphaerota archaeon]MDG6946545.1 hypothetical protein [Nitrososphaerota archaeon]MDG6947702.1 hypothetical protein [Nitrososphaerota archaeon]
MTLTSIAASLANFSWGLALGFSLAIVVLISLFLLLAFPKKELELTVKDRVRRAFKGEQVSSEIRLGSGRWTPRATLEVLSAPEGLETVIRGEERDRTLAVRSKYAGVYQGISLKVGILDPLGLFVRKEVHALQVSYEFLPTSLLAKEGPLRLTALIPGDYPGGRRGFGQEFYATEPYGSSSNSKDIMWKRQAKLSYESLMVRVGEANIPEQLSVCFVEKMETDPKRLPRWMDLASEALASVGLPVVSTGITLRVEHVKKNGTAVAEARDLGGLASLIMKIWTGVEPGTIDDERDHVDMVITAEEETQAPETMRLVLDKPSVILCGSHRRREVQGTNVMFYTGHEDVSNLVASVLSR